MHVTCPGCGEPFKRSGLAHHIRQSNNPRCRLPGVRQQSEIDLGMQDTQDDIPPTPVCEPTVMDAHINKLPEQVLLGVDPAGDIFGDYANYMTEDPALDDGEDQDLNGPSAGEDAESVAESQEEDDTFLAKEEQHMEPERPLRCPGIMDQELDHDVLPSRRPLRLRGGFEGPLSNPPEIVEFSVGNAGSRFKTNHRGGNQSYLQSISNADNPNPYEPFSSKLDWEIARWAKRRGQGSNALMELLKINGVSLCRCAKHFGDSLF